MTDRSEFRKIPLTGCDDERGTFGTEDDNKGTEKRKLLSSDALANRRRWGCVAALAALLLVVIAVIIIAVVLRRRSEARKSPPQWKPKMSFSDVFNPELSPVMLGEVKWMPKSAKLYRLVDDGNFYVIEVLDVSNGSVVPEWTALAVLPPDVIDNEGLGSVSISPDERFLLFSTEPTQIYRHSTTAKYFILRLGFPQEYIGIANRQRIRYITWSQQDARLVLVYESSTDTISVIPRISALNDSAIIEPVRLMESSGLASGLLLRGVPDWLYEEEILNQAGAIWCSPDDSHVVYLETNETKVKNFEWVHFGDPHDQYVQVKKIHYPKAGRRNPTISLRVAQNAFLPNRSIISLKAPNDTSEYLMQVHWLNSTHVSALWMDRRQEKATIAIYAMPAGEDPVATFKWSAPIGWIENYPYTSADNGRTLLLRLPSREPGLFIHLARISITPGHINSTPEFITSGDWEVAGIKQVDTANNVVWITATVLGPETRNLYRIALNSSNVTSPECATCHGGWSCLFNDVDLSVSSDHVLWRCRGPELPQVQLASLESRKADVLVVLENNSDFSAAVSKLALPKQEFIRIPANGYSLPAMRLVPLNVSSAGPLPTLFYAYNGPLVQTVTAAHFLLFGGPIGLWHAFLASRYNIQVIIVDGRGTPYLGDKFGKAQYQRFGVVESADQLAAGRYAIKHLNADPKKMAFWGWSYGGFLSSYIASSGDDVFGTCIAVAPVTDWKYYDTAYTERYMRLPFENDNLAGYNQSSVILRAANFSSTKYLVVHGTGDDNVHFQNLAELATALTKNLFQFRMHFYTDKMHSLGGPRTQMHFFRLLTDFLTESFGLK